MTRGAPARIAASLDITERSPFGIIDLVEAGYMVKEKNGRRNRYHIQAHRPLPELVIGRDLSQLSHGLTGRYGTVASVMDTR